MTTLLYTHPACLEHDPGRHHPESAARLHAVLGALADPEFAGLERREAPEAALEDLIRVHPRHHVERMLRAVPRSGHVGIDADTILSPGSGRAALRAAGAVAAAVDAVIGGEADNAFCAVRPPGHHAEPRRPMGFCLFNNIGVAAAFAIEKKGLERVAIVDFDVHHGNGTEDMFSAPRWQDRVLMVSFFQHPFYPGSGTEDPAPNMINIPLAAGSDGRAARGAVENHWLPALQKFKPQLVLILAGFDAHREDLLGGLALEEEDYEWMTRELVAVARQHSDNRIVSMLEGGYNFAALGRSAVAHVRALATA
jgi:acetoin utilization deacetylase AcuC-like enzyme